MNSINEWAEKFLGRPSRLLIVEDNVENVELIQRSLENYDCEVDVADTVQDARHLVCLHSYALVFVSLQEDSGLELLRTIKTIAPSTPVVVMTGYFSGEILDQTAQLGVVSFVRTPLDFNPRFIRELFSLFKINASEMAATTL